MSFVTKLSSLDPGLLGQIRQDCHLKEKYNPFANKSRYHKPEPKRCRVWREDPVNDLIYLPMAYASKLYQTPLVNKCRTYPKITPFAFQGQLRDYQEEVIAEARKRYATNSGCFYNVFCSFGKTVVGIYSACRFSEMYQVPTLILHPRNIIGDSWIGSALAFSNASIFVYGSGYVCSQYHPCDGSVPGKIYCTARKHVCHLHHWNKQYHFHPTEDGEPLPGTQIYIACIDSFHQIKSTVLESIGHLVIDEAHMFCTDARIQKLLMVSPLALTVLTATYDRTDGLNKALDLFVGEDRIYRISSKEFYVIQYHTRYIGVSEKEKNYQDLIKNLAANEERNNEIIQFVLANPQEKIGILCLHVERAKKLADMIDAIYASYGWPNRAGRLYGTTKKNEKYTDSNVIVGTYSKIGVGWDEKESCADWNGKRINMAILADSTKQIEQIAGRFFRAEVPIIIEFVDQDNQNGMLLKQSKSREKWYVSRNGVVIKDITGPFCWEQWGPMLIERAKNGG